MAQDADLRSTRSAYEALLAGRVAAATTLLDDASVLHLAGRSGVAGDYQGQEAILGLLRRIVQLTDGTLEFGAATTLVDDARVMVLRGRLTGTRRKARLDTEVLHVLSLRDDRIREAWIFSLDQNHLYEFWTR